MVPRSLRRYIVSVCVCVVCVCVCAFVSVCVCVCADTWSLYGIRSIERCLVARRSRTWWASRRSPLASSRRAMPPALRPSRRRKAKRAARVWSMVVLQIMCGDTKGFVTGRLSQGHGLQSQWAVKGGSRGRRGVTTVVDGGAHQERFLQRFAAEAKFCRVERVSTYEVVVDRPCPVPCALSCL